MSNRMLRDWTNSDRIDSISYQAEVLFLRLIMKADDFGCFWADSKRLKANLFPLRSDSIRETDITRWLAECQKAGLVVVYESDNKRYLQILDFNQRLRTKRRQFPEPDSELLRPADNCLLEEEIEVEEEVELEREGEGEISHTVFNENNNSLKNKKEKYSSPGPEISYTIEHCLTVAMNDERWVKDSKASPEKLALFNCYLSGQGIYEKNPMDYKKHFFNWSKKQNGTHQSDYSKFGKAAGTIKAAHELAKELGVDIR